MGVVLFGGKIKQVQGVTFHCEKLLKGKEDFLSLSRSTNLYLFFFFVIRAPQRHRRLRISKESERCGSDTLSAAQGLLNDACTLHWSRGDDVAQCK